MISFAFFKEPANVTELERDIVVIVVRHGIRANVAQFSLLVLLVVFLGAVVGVERSVLPLLAGEAFGIASATATLSFLVAFGFSKALANLAAGTLADRVGRRAIMRVGWLFGLAVPPLIMTASSWGWVTAANLLLGANQGLVWSTAIIMKIDLAGLPRRGLARGSRRPCFWVWALLRSIPH